MLSKVGLKPEQQIHIGVACGLTFEDCSFNIVAELAAELILENAQT